jgi:catechol 2,3-dioxygenase-like lactoylglutathione lyase family enzyme
MTRRLFEPLIFAIGAALIYSATPGAAMNPSVGSVGADKSVYAARAHAAEQVERPKIYSIAFVRFETVDLDKSRAFYAQTLGLQSGFDSCKGMRDPCFAVNPYQYVQLTQTGASERGSFLEEVGFNVSDVEQMHAYLLAHGLKPGAITRGGNNLRYFETEDPEHNLIAFVELSGADAQINGQHQVSDRLFHAGWVVHNLADDKKFYSDLLGFRLYWYGGFKDADTDWYEIQVPDGDNWVEFMLNIPSTADHAELGVQNHFSLGVSDIKACLAKLRANGLQSKDAPEIGRDGKWSFDIYDPDGNRVEFMEFAPAHKPCCHPYTAAHPK